MLDSIRLAWRNISSIEMTQNINTPFDKAQDDDHIAQTVIYTLISQCRTKYARLNNK